MHAGVRYGVTLAMSLLISVLGWVEYSLLLNGKVCFTRKSQLSLFFSLCISLFAWARIVMLARAAT